MITSPVSIGLTEWSRITATDPQSPLTRVFLEEAGAKELAKRLTAAGMLEITEMREGLSVSSTSYVGRIALGNIQITIHPKISGTSLIHLLHYVYGLRDLHLHTLTGFESEKQVFQDVLIYQLIAEVSELVARGLHRRYRRTEQELVSLRGRIDVSRIAKQGGIIQETIPCISYPRLEDCLVNQALLQGLQLAARLTSDSSLRLHLYRLISLLQESVSAIKLDAHILKKLHREMDRLIMAYRPAITLIEMLLAGEGISLAEDQQRIQLPGFLFDMNIFFQALLLRFLTEHIAGYEVLDQHQIKDMMSYDPAHNPKKRRAPAPRPDYVIMHQSKVIAILDAKYRDLWEHSLPPHMLYQLAIYALSQPEGMHATILYPTMQAEAQEAQIMLRDPVYGAGRTRVVLRPVNLLRMEQLITDARTAKNERERVAFARQLAFGEKEEVRSARLSGEFLEL